MSRVIRDPGRCKPIGVPSNSLITRVPFLAVASVFGVLLLSSCCVLCRTRVEGPSRPGSYPAPFERRSPEDQPDGLRSEVNCFCSPTSVEGGVNALKGIGGAVVSMRLTTLALLGHFFSSFGCFLRIFISLFKKACGLGSDLSQLNTGADRALSSCFTRCQKFPEFPIFEEEN